MIGAGTQRLGQGPKDQGRDSKIGAGMDGFTMDHGPWWSQNPFVIDHVIVYRQCQYEQEITAIVGGSSNVFYFQWNKAGMQLTVAKWQTHLCSWIIFYYKRSSPCLIIQGLQLQKPQKEDVLQKKLWTKAIGKIYGLSRVWHSFYCFGNDAN